MTNPTEMVFRRRGVAGAYWALLVACIIVSSAVTLYLAPSRQAVTTVTTNVNSVTSTVTVTSSTTSTATMTPPANTSLLGLNPVVIYRQASPSVVTVQGVQMGVTGNASILGSGFVTDFQGIHYIITNYHVVQEVVDLTVTFSDGNAYPAGVVGKDAYVDLAVVSAQAPQV